MNYIKPGYELRFKEGDIVYWCHHDANAKYSVHWGRVDTQFHDVVCIDYLKLKERRLVDGVPIEEFESEQRFRKLPKGWLLFCTLDDAPLVRLNDGVSAG